MPLTLHADAPLPAPSDRGLWLGYVGLCALCWVLYAMAGTEWQRGSWRLWEGVYEATWNLGPPMVLGVLGLPWARRLGRPGIGTPLRLVLHGVAALAFVAAWQTLDVTTATLFYGQEHAGATFEQRVLWLTMWGVFVYVALMLGFGGALHARSAHQAAVLAARADAARVRAELAAISGKLNPHFLFNTLNSLLLLTRRDPAAAEQSLLRFSRMMRYVLDTRRDAADRVPLRDELEFVRDYLALEALRLGPRLKVEWAIDPATLDDPIPPLTLQPLVENSVVHGISPQLAGGTVRIAARHRTTPAMLALQVADDGAGCAWPLPEPAPARPGGVGLSALRRRFELDFGGQARLVVRSAPGAGFAVEILIPHAAAAA